MWRIQRLLVLRALAREREEWEEVPEQRLLVSAEWREGYVEALRVAESIVLNGGTRRYGV